MCPCLLFTPVAADVTRGMLTFLNSGGTVNYASNGIWVCRRAGRLFRRSHVVVVHRFHCGSGRTSGDHLGYTCYLAAPGVVVLVRSL